MSNVGKMVSRCTGGCCCGFTLNVSPGYLKERTYSDGEEGEQARLILSCVLYGHTEEGVGGGAPVIRYNCRHLQENGDCGIYTTRPKMCVDYPGDRACQVEGCTLRRE